MSQRISGYKRIDWDSYETPEWVTEALIPHLPTGIKEVWEPACGTGKIVAVLERHFSKVIKSDILTGENFFDIGSPAIQAIITNPPYNQATEFIERALLKASHVAMLLRTDFDHARSRQHLFKECQAFYKKVVLTKRIRWIEGSTGQPSFNHAWFIWSHFHWGPPSIAYAP